MSTELGKRLVESFLKDSMFSIKNLVKELRRFNEGGERSVPLFYMKNNQVNKIIIGCDHFFLRSSVEYSNPQLTLEEVQGIIAARLLEACGNYFDFYGLSEVGSKDIDEICERLIKPQSGKCFSFLLNTDDVEADRYSMNPLRASIVKSGQSAFPSATVKLEGLRIDQSFMRKYEGKLVSRCEAEMIEHHLESWDSYVDMVDAVKYEHLESLSETFGIDLRLPSMRMPITVLKGERAYGLLHHIITESHRDYDSIKSIYNCMGRSMKKKTTLLTVPHSEKGYGSKRAARGRIYFEDGKLKSVKVTYRTTPLYPNAIDPDDISVAKADDSFTVEGRKLTKYDFSKCPSSPQFILYSLASPEGGVIWHGIGEFGASQLVRSYTTIHAAYARKKIFRDLREKYGVSPRIPLQFNLVPERMWVHPVYRNIDASIGCVEDFEELIKMGMKIELLLSTKYIRG